MKIDRNVYALIVAALVLPTYTVLSQQQRAPWPPPAAHEIYEQQEQEKAGDEAPSIPNRFLARSRGYEQALELQKATGADIFLYVKHNSPPGARGLCNWWENRGMRAGNVQRWLRHYIKVELPLPSDAATREIAERFHLWEGPTIVVLHPNGRHNSIRVFERPDGGRMQLRSPDEIVELIQGASSPQYQELRR